MALDNFKCYHLMSLHCKGLMRCVCIEIVSCRKEQHKLEITVEVNSKSSQVQNLASDNSNIAIDSNCVIVTTIYIISNVVTVYNQRCHSLMNYNR